MLNPKNPAAAWMLPFEGAWTTSVALLGSHRRVAAGDRQGRLLVWDLPEEPVSKTVRDDKGKDRQEIEAPPPALQLVGHTGGITHLIAIDGGKRLISASLDHTIRIWDLDAPPSGETELVLDDDTRTRRARYKSEQEKKAILEAPGVKVKTLTQCEVLAGHGDWIKALGISRDQKRLISGDDRGLSIVWDLPARKEIARWSGYPGNWVSSAALSPDGQTAFVAEYCMRRGDFDRPPAQAKIYNAGDGKLKVDLLVVRFPKVKNRDNSYGYATTWGKFVGQGFVAADFSPDGKLLAVGKGGESGDGKVHLIDPATGKLVRTIGGHKYGTTDVAFSADGRHVLSSGRDTLVRVMQTADGKEVATIGKTRGGQFTDWIHAFSLSPDERWLATADISGLVRMWRFGA